MQKVYSKDGTPIAYRRSGAGPPLLLVHGATASHKRWAPISPLFEGYFTVLAMDRRGRGGSGDTPPYHILREAEDIAAIVDSFDQPVHVLGHSFGALCSLEAALLTDNIKRLVLYEPPVPGIVPTVTPEILERVQALSDQGELEAALETFMREVVKMPEHELAEYRQLPMWQERVRIIPVTPREVSFDSDYSLESERFARLRVRTLLLQGGDSPAFYHEGIAAIHAMLPDSRVISLPGQQHIAMDTDPEMFARTVMRFLDS